jgi:hypothetical protein
VSQAAALLTLQALLAAKTGSVNLPNGRIEVASELRIPDGARNLTITGSNTTLAASAGFRGRAILSCKRCEHLTIRNLSLDGNRAALETPLPIPPSDVAFARFYANNGILLEDNSGLTIDRVKFSNIANLAMIVSHSRDVKIDHISVDNSGSRNAKGRNNTTGGVLLEEGTQDFSIAGSSFTDIRGNAAWTHSRYRSPRNLRGRIEGNEFAGIGRDAIQVGHASEVKVTGNTGRRIGLDSAEVDVEGGGTPVGIDTAGNVDHSIYEHNRFEEVNGKCIDLDGFHDGMVRGNTCINRGKPEDYPYGNFGISMNNTSVEMQSRNIVIESNTLDGMKFGGIFVIGSGHNILHNTMRHLNTAHCNETHAKFGCLAIAGEPGFLESGIYLARGAEKPDPARHNTIQGNIISGWKMAQYCVRAAPGISPADNNVQGNRCGNE